MYICVYIYIRIHKYIYICIYTYTYIYIGLVTDGSTDKLITDILTGEITGDTEEITGDNGHYLNSLSIENRKLLKKRVSPENKNSLNVNKNTLLDKPQTPPSHDTGLNEVRAVSTNNDDYDGEYYIEYDQKNDIHYKNKNKNVLFIPPNIMDLKPEALMELVVTFKAAYTNLSQVYIYLFMYGSYPIRQSSRC
jgi:hypothetical protein